MWNLRLLGSLTLRRAAVAQRKKRGNDIVRFRSRSADSLFAYLVLHPGLHSREFLATLLWPDSIYERACNNLRSSLLSLRRQLEPIGTVPGSIVLANRLSIGLREDAFTCDVALFQEHWKTAQCKTGPERIESLQAAFDLYEGRLLAGYYDQWLEPLALYLESLCERIADELIAWYRQVGEIEMALSVANQAATRLDDPEAFVELLGQLKEEAYSDNQYRDGPYRTQVDAGAANTAPAVGAFSSESKPAATAAEQTTLPLYATQFRGRSDEMTALLENIRSSSPLRLLTLVGAPGMGKTRMAVEAAWCALNSGEIQKAHFVSYAAVQAVASLSETLRAGIGLRANPGVEPLEQAVEALRLQVEESGAVLLLLDNLEHLLPDVAFWLQTLRSRVPRLLIWTTSRAPLRLPGEELLLLEGLPIPRDEDDLAAITVSPSVELFVQRARGAKPDFRLNASNASSLKRLCRHLEGWPLALELAAARAYSFTPAQMEEQLHNDHQFLMRKTQSSDLASARQNSLQTAIEWSYHLLAPETTQLFLSLAVFRGGATAENVKAVSGQQRTLAHLSELVAHSLVTCKEKGGLLHYDLLEGVRQFARGHLSKNEWYELRCLHAQTFAQWLAYAAEWTGTTGSCWLEQLDREHENLNGALEWAHEADPVLLFHLTCNLWKYWEARGLSSEGRGWLEKALQKADFVPADKNGTRAKIVAWNALSRLLFASGDFGASEQAAEKARVLAERAMDETGMAQALLNFGKAWLYQGKIKEALEALQASRISFQGKDASGEARALIFLGFAGIFGGAFEESFQTYQSAVVKARKSEDLGALAMALFYCGDVLGPVGGRYNEALPYFEESLALTTKIGDEFIGTYAQWGLCRAAIAAPELEIAQNLFEQVHYFCRRSSSLWGQVFVLETAALLAAARAEWKQAALLLGAAEAAHEQLSFPLTPSYYAELHRQLAPLWENLPATQLKKQWRLGRRHTLAQAMEAALGKTVSAKDLIPEQKAISPLAPPVALMGFPMDTAHARPALAESYLGCGRLALHCGDVERAKEHLQKASDLYEATGNSESQSLAQHWLVKATAPMS